MIAVRLAADHVNATKMDRPEWAAVHPLNGDVYLALTNNRTGNARGECNVSELDPALGDKVNNQMLVAIPGRVGDGDAATINTTVGADSRSVQTFVGKSAEAVQLKRFFVGPKGCEITGIYLTPDARTPQQWLSPGKTGGKIAV